MSERENIDEPTFLADRLFDMIKRIAPEMSDATAWKLVVAIITTMADEQGMNLT